MDVKISIVVPIYNGQKYIEKLLDTLERQTYKNLEFLFVDDFSTDNAFKIIEEHKKSDDRIKIIKMVKKGGFAAKGVEYAFDFCTGEYFWFMSHDDFLDNNFFEKCVQKINETNADVLIPNCVLYYEGKTCVNTFNFPINNDYSKEIDNYKAFENSLTWKLHGNTLRKISLLKKIGMKAEFYNSDEVCSRLSYFYAEKISFVDTNFYYRQDNPNAITKSIKWFMVDLLSTDILLFSKLTEICNNKNILSLHLTRLNKFYFWWFLCLYLKKLNLTKENKLYIKSSLKKSRKDLLFFNKKIKAKYSFFLFPIL